MLNVVSHFRSLSTEKPTYSMRHGSFHSICVSPKMVLKNQCVIKRCKNGKTATRNYYTKGQCRTRILREAIKMCETSVKIIQLNEWRCRDAPSEK